MKLPFYMANDILLFMSCFGLKPEDLSNLLFENDTLGDYNE